MSAQSGARRVGFDELATLKLLAMEGGHRGEVKVSCADLADRLDASNQTASRRLQALEDAGFLERDLVSDGQWVVVTDDGVRELEREYQDYRRIFEERGDLTLSGSVTGGMGEGRHYISLPGYNRQFKEKLGYEPYPGTLNVSLDTASKRSRSALDAFDAIPIDGWEDEERTYGSASCYPATVENRATSEKSSSDGDRSGTVENRATSEKSSSDGDQSGAVENTDGQTFAPVHVIVPDRTHHDEGELELIAPDKLRDELGLLDDDIIDVHVEDATTDLTAGGDA